MTTRERTALRRLYRSETTATLTTLRAALVLDAAAGADPEFCRGRIAAIDAVLATRTKTAAALGRLGGAVRSARQVAAARTNGRKGGRPRTPRKDPGNGE